MKSERGPGACLRRGICLRALLAGGFAQVLERAARCGQLPVGDMTVAVDGTKVLANASRHAAVSYARLASSCAKSGGAGRMPAGPDPRTATKKPKPL
ncbi:MAG: hypothetical protein PHE83_06685 [Opitutaceae bacterium]|nr:hypothetical protein [Opitutaceae bacterium]